MNVWICMIKWVIFNSWAASKMMGDLFINSYYHVHHACEQSLDSNKNKHVWTVFASISGDVFFSCQFHASSFHYLYQLTTLWLMLKEWLCTLTCLWGDCVRTFFFYSLIKYTLLKQRCYFDVMLKGVVCSGQRRIKYIYRNETLQQYFLNPIFHCGNRNKTLRQLYFICRNETLRQLYSIQY